MKKLVVTGAAGLVGQNLIAQLEQQYSDYEIVALDKSSANLAVLERLHPDVRVELCDLAEVGAWMSTFTGATEIVILNAQIGAKTFEPFERNNIVATINVIDAIKRHCPTARVVHVSSSVVNSVVNDFYVQTKRDQEELVRERLPGAVVLRPTLMFGWFDRKHLGWLSRFMKRVPLFPVPGHGRYVRQPLFVADFCNIILSCLHDNQISGDFDISGLEEVFYVEMIREIKKVSKSRALILPIPYSVFWSLLKIYALFDRNPPFTVDQLEALVAPDSFSVIDWPGIFGVRPTPFVEAIKTTFNDPVYAQEVLEF